MSLILDALKKLDREKIERIDEKVDVTAGILKAGDSAQRRSILPLVSALAITASLAAVGRALAAGRADADAGRADADAGRADADAGREDVAGRADAAGRALAAGREFASGFLLTNGDLAGRSFCALAMLTTIQRSIR